MTTILQKLGASGVYKIDESLRLAIGWANVSTVNGSALVDQQGEIVPASEIVRAAAEFMAGDRPALLAHAGSEVGKVVFCMPITDDIANSLGFTSRCEGIVVGIRVSDDAVWKMVRDGGLRAFSIGGNAAREPA